MRRGIAGIAGSRILDVGRAPCARRPILITPRIDVFRRRSVGKRIQSIDRVGKRVVLRLDSADSIVLEPRMTGLVLLTNPPTQEHLRFRIRLERPSGELLFWDRRGLGVVRLVSQLQFAELYGDHKLGPDALTVSRELLRSRLASSHRPIKVALLDQRAIAGIGNLYASEILHMAGVHPARPCTQLRRTDWQRVYAGIREVLESAIRHEGSTLSDGTYRNALSQNGGYQNYHRVYDREGDRCSTCGCATIERIVQAQRSTFLCNHCQPKSVRRAASASRNR